MNPDKLKAALKRKKLTQREVAILTNSTEAEVSNFINGYSNPTLNKLLNFIRVLELNFDECFRDENINDTKN